MAHQSTYIKRTHAAIDAMAAHLSDVYGNAPTLPRPSSRYGAFHATMQRVEALAAWLTAQTLNVTIDLSTDNEVSVGVGGFSLSEGTGSSDAVALTADETDYTLMTRDELASLVEELGIEVIGTGKGGSILKADLVEALTHGRANTDD